MDNSCCWRNGSSKKLDWAYERLMHSCTELSDVYGAAGFNNRSFKRLLRVFPEKIAIRYNIIQVSQVQLAGFNL